MKKIYLFSIALITVVALAGCSTASNTTTAPSAAVSPTDGQISVDLSEYAFSPNNYSLVTGVATTFTLKNSGSLEHTFTVSGLNINETLKAGETKTVSVTPTSAGTFDVICTMAGHEQFGMKGQITVSEASI